MGDQCDSVSSLSLPGSISGGTDINDTDDLFVVSDGTETTLRCPQGYVFPDSWKLYSSNEDDAYVSYTSEGWLNSQGSPVETWYSENSEYSCEPEYCEPLSIVDSDRELDPLVGTLGTLGTLGTEVQSVQCNEGYIFDHDMRHRRGHVKCGYLPKFEPESLKTKNTMAWLVHNPHLEEICSSKSPMGQEECTRATDPLNDNQEIGCVWSPGYTSDGFTKQSECMFIERADENATNPICKPMYCGEKSVANSDRVEGRQGPLPGPSTEREHGSCIDFNGQIINQITNSSDCNCFKHKSCDNCTASPDCQWCGYDPTTGEGGFCYSVKTDLQACNTHIRNDDTGTCSHVLSDEDRDDPESADPERYNAEGDYLWTRSECETNTCASETNWNIGIEDTSTLMIQGQEMSRDSVTLEQCNSSNNHWNPQGSHSYMDKCIFTNNQLEEELQIRGSLPYYPLNGGKLSAKENICVPTSNYSITANTGCNVHTSRADCIGSGGCQWIQNPLRDSLFHWSSDYRLNFSGTGTTCPFPDNDGGYSISYDSGSKEITVTGVDANDTIYSTSNCYILPSDIFGSDLFSETICSDHQGNRIEATSCRNGVAYCDSLQEVQIGGTAVSVCPTADVDIIPGTDIEGCLYSPTAPAVQGDNYCHSNRVTPRCSEFGDAKPYNCTKNNIMLESTIPDSINNELRCLSTGYTTGQLESVDGVNSIPDEFDGSEIKEFLVCDIPGQNKQKKCEFIGEEHAHYGEFCQIQNSDRRVPKKHVCNALGYIYEYQNDGYQCIDTEGNPIVDVDVCAVLNDGYTVDGVSADYITKGDDETWDSSTSGLSECIIDSDTLDKVELCESSENHADGFQYIDSSNLGDYTGVCEANDETRQASVNDITNQFECEQNNNTYVQKYNFYNTGSCTSLPDRLEDQPDVPTTWTGGEILMEENDIHRSECSASIMSSCNVDCDDGFGGGGEYICHYNSDASTVCSDVNDLSLIELAGSTRETVCARYPACTWNGDECQTDTSSTDPTDNFGHMEWLGSECYKLNNDAFSHGIAPMPELDELLPPFVRIIIFLVLLTLIVLPLGTMSFYFILMGLGKLLDVGVDGTMEGIKKGIDFNFQSTDIPSLFTSKFSKLFTMNKSTLLLVLLVAPILISFGTVYFFKHFNESVSLAVDKLADGLVYTYRYVYAFILSIRIGDDGLEFGSDGDSDETD